MAMTQIAASQTAISMTTALPAWVLHKPEFKT